MSNQKKYTIHADGICEPNPGRAAYGYVIFDESGKIVREAKEFLGNNLTNNHAEYIAVGKALAYAEKNLKDVQIEVLTDSQLVVRQVSGEWSCNIRRLQLMRDRVRQLLDLHGNATVGWIPGAENKADKLTRQAYEEATGIYPIPRVKIKKAA